MGVIDAMALVHFFQTTKENLDVTEYTEGNIYFVTDTCDLYIDLNGTRNQIINSLKSYPVGSVYIDYCTDNGDNYSPGESPAQLFGGTWEQITGDRHVVTAPSGTFDLTGEFRTDGLLIGGTTRYYIHLTLWRRIA